MAICVGWGFVGWAVQLVAILSQRKAIEGFILSQDNQKYIEKMGWFAYSLQEVFSYFILSPRCLYDGSKVAYGGREWLKLELRRTHDALGRPEDGPI